MGERNDLRRGLAAAASFTVIAALLAACSPGPSEPAPVFLRGAGPTAARKPPPSPARNNTMFTVRKGDTVIDIAHDCHVPLGALIAANQLRTPYLIHPGDQLLIPDGGMPVADYTRMAAAAPPAVAPGPTPMQTAALPPRPAPTQIAATPLPPAPGQTAAPTPQAVTQIAALPPRPASTQIAAATLPLQPMAQTPAIVPPAPPQVAAAAPASVPATPAPASIPAPSPPTPQVVALASHPATPAQPVLAPLHLAAPPQTVAAKPLMQPPAPTQVAVIAPQPAMVAPHTAPPPQAVAAAPSQPPAPAPTAVAAAPQPPTNTVADVTPLDPPVKQLAAIEPLPPPPAAAPPAAPATSNGPPSVLAARNPAAALPLPGEPAPNLPVQTSAGRFLWPVHGRILTSYGSTNGGPHNEGINIAAPLGTPVRTIDAGTIAYVGNEVKGYGNLVLIRHADGWISAYAHLDDIMVKKGDSVAAGEVIAKVGATDEVGEPQLHFELRRGKKPVDPREFLDPTGSAAARVTQKAG